MCPSAAINCCSVLALKSFCNAPNAPAQIIRLVSEFFNCPHRMESCHKEPRKPRYIGSTAAHWYFKQIRWILGLTGLLENCRMPRPLVQVPSGKDRCTWPGAGFVLLGYSSLYMIIQATANLFHVPWIHGLHIHHAYKQSTNPVTWLQSITSPAPMPSRWLEDAGFSWCKVKAKSPLGVARLAGVRRAIIRLGPRGSTVGKLNKTTKQNHPERESTTRKAGRNWGNPANTEPTDNQHTKNGIKSVNFKTPKMGPKMLFASRKAVE